ncbi:hypothetical protein GCM10010388_08970 [Streptomyces mauvecolor]
MSQGGTAIGVRMSGWAGGRRLASSRHRLAGRRTELHMAKGQDSKKDTKKKPLKTRAEKKAKKKAKK